MSGLAAWGSRGGSGEGRRTGKGGKSARKTGSKGRSWSDGGWSPRKRKGGRATGGLSYPTGELRKEERGKLIEEEKGRRRYFKVEPDSETE